MLRLLACAALVLSLAVPARGDDEPKETLAQIKAKEQVQAIAEVAGLPIINAKSIDEIVQVTVQNNDIRLHTPLPPTDDSLVSIPGMPGLMRVRLQGSGEGEDFVLVQLHFEIRDYTVADAVAAFTSVSYAAGTTTLAQAWETADDQTYSVQLLQTNRPLAEGEPRVSLYVQVTGEPLVDLRFTADNVVELRRQHPAEVAKYVDPMLRALRQGELLAEVDSKLAWQVFADLYKPSDELTAKVKSVVAKLNADSFQDREAASAELEKLGQPAALVLMRSERASLSEEQRGRIDAFLARFKSVPDEQAKKYRHDRDFLIDCLYSDDRSIQQHALAELRRLTGKNIQFDFSADPQRRAQAIARLRESFGTPATQQFKG